MKKALSLMIALAFVLSLCMAGFADDLGIETTADTTTAPPDTTTAPPDTTTAPPDTTTAPPDTTTAPPDTTTAPPDTTTAPPDTTTTPPETTTVPTEPTTAAPTVPPTASFPTVTKDPTSETVRKGGYAEFVARANNCTDIIWYLQSPDGSTNVLAKDAPARFPGLVVTGLGTERLGLDQIPKTLDQWRVRAEFVGISGNVWSGAAIIRVMDPELTAPTIQTQPSSANLNEGETTSLRVSAATSDQGATLTYQWYSNSINSNTGGKAILGATSATYIPSYTPGTVYYYCVVRSTNGTDISASTKTACAAVSYAAAETETTVPTTQPTSAATLAPWDTETETTDETLPSTVPITTPTRTLARSNTLLVVIVVVIVVIAVLGVVAAVIILKFYGDRDDYQQPDPKPRRPAPAPQQKAQAPRQAPRQQPKQPPKQPSIPEEDPEWDDLSDLDLSYYLDDEDDL